MCVRIIQVLRQEAYRPPHLHANSLYEKCADMVPSPLRRLASDRVNAAEVFGPTFPSTVRAAPRFQPRWKSLMACVSREEVLTRNPSLDRIAALCERVSAIIPHHLPIGGLRQGSSRAGSP